MKQSLTGSEWIVMSALWGEPPLMLSEIEDKLVDEVDWSYSTLATHVSRLSKKGFLGYEKRANRRFYSPTVSMDDCAKAESESVFDRVSKESTKHLLLHMIKDAKLTRQDTDELLELIDQLQKEE